MIDRRIERAEHSAQRQADVFGVPATVQAGCRRAKGTNFAPDRLEAHATVRSQLALA
jgi:hypothetical protein